MAARFNLLPFQKDAARHIIREGKGSGGLFLEMGCGKTRVALAVAKALKCKRILIVAPLSVPSVWVAEAAKVWPEMPVHPVCVGPLAKRAASARALLNSEEQVTIIVNYEGYWREPLRALLLASQFDMVIYDEAHRLAHRGSRQSRMAHLLQTRIPHRLALTGTPMPNGPEDLFSLYKALRLDTFGNRWFDFQARYLRMGGFQGHQIVGYYHTDEIEERLTATAYRITKEEAVDLPERTDVTIRIPLDNRTAYDQMRRRSLTEVSGTDEEGRPLSGTALARIAAVNIMRLSQMTSGFVRTEEGDIVELSDEKLRALADLLEDTLTQQTHAVVFCRFTPDVNRVARWMQNRAAHVAILDGNVPQKDREGVLSFWRTVGGVLVVQVKVGSLGIDLTAASTAVFYSLDYSLVDYLQARDRLHRMGQTRKVTYYHLTVENSVDDHVVAALQAKEDLTKSLLDRRRVLEIFS